jgi:hypothetical protein
MGIVMKTVWILMLAGGLALMSVDVMATKMYRWTDANGNPVVSDRPPPAGTPFTEISSQYTPDRRREALRNIPEAPAEEEGAQSEWLKDPERCEATRDRIRKLETASRIAMEDEEGNVSILSDEERARELANARKVAERYCEN